MTTRTENGLSVGSWPRVGRWRERRRWLDAVACTVLLISVAYWAVLGMTGTDLIATAFDNGARLARTANGAVALAAAYALARLLPSRQHVRRRRVRAAPG